MEEKKAKLDEKKLGDVAGGYEIPDEVPEGMLISPGRPTVPDKPAPNPFEPVEKPNPAPNPFAPKDEQTISY